jgi:hypothetical protein
MKRQTMFNYKPETRKWIYGVIASVVPLLVILGLLSEDLALPILDVVAALLTVGGSALAIKNVPNK